MASFLRHARFERRPVSPRRRWLGLAGLLFVLGVIGGYRLLTRPERIRLFAETYLQKITGGIVRIHSARFDIFEGVHLTSVRVATQPDPCFDPQHNSFDERVIFTSQDLYLKLRPFSLITGDLVVPEIVAFEPNLRLLKDPDTGARNWQFLLPQRKKPGRPIEKSPTIRLRGASVDLAWTRPSSGRAPSRLAIDVTAASTDGSLHDVRWRTRTDPIENGRFVLDMSSLTLRTAEGGLPTIPMASVRWAAPIELERWLELLDLRGQVRADSLSYDPTKGSNAQITLRDASLAVPADEQDRATPRDQRYLTFTGVQGQLVFRGLSVDVALTGQWRGGTCSLTGRIFADTSTMSSFDDLGFDITLEGKQILLPAPAARRSPAEARFIEKWPKFVDFCEFYSPEGRIDLAFSVAKQPGRERSLEFRGGRMVPRTAAATFIGFPYRLHDLNGAVCFEPDGRVRIEKLTGRHGRATVTVDGILTTPTWACGVDLHIEGQGVELDESLHRCLSITYRNVWETFDPRGCANVSVSMRRAPGTGKKTKPWDTNVTADLLGISACYERLPLAMTDVRGRIQITPEEFLVRTVRGRHRDASWSIDGVVATPPDRPPQVDLHIESGDLPVNEELAGALPEAGGRLLAALHARGSAEISGKLFTGTDDALDFDLHAQLALSSLCPDAVPLSLTDVHAALHILSRQVELSEFIGRYESGIVGLRGVIPLTDQADPLRLEARGHQIPLTDALFQVLPARAQQAWSALGPAGHVDARVELWRPDVHSNAPLDAEVEITARGLTLSPTAFPLKISDITGTFRATQRLIQIDNAAGTIAGGSIFVDGHIDWGANAPAGELEIRTEGTAFSHDIRRALPWRARRAWDALQPTGRFDLSLRRLEFERTTGGPMHWAFDGRLDLHEVDFAAGGTLRGLEGTIDVRGSMAGPGTNIGIDGGVDLKRLSLGKRIATNVRGTLEKNPEEAALHVDNLRADMYGGLATGFADLRFSPDGTTYGLSAVVRDISLAAFLEAGRPDNAKPITAQGSVEGTLFLNGSLGEKHTRRGGGSLRIKDAQIMKIPLLLAVVGALNLAPPDENAFHEGTADFTLQGDSLALGSVDLRGNSVSLVGAGRMNTASQELDLTLLAGSPHRLPRLGLLTELAEGAARELMEVRVRGSLHEPHIEAQSMRSLRQTLEVIGQIRTKPRDERLLRR